MTKKKGIESRQILLTGASGYVGSRLWPKLETQGYRVRCMARNPEKLHNQVGSETEVVKGNVLDIVSLHQALKGKLKNTPGRTTLSRRHNWPVYSASSTLVVSVTKLKNYPNTCVVAMELAVFFRIRVFQHWNFVPLRSLAQGAYLLN